MPETDILIVGAGLAGTLLALELEAAGRRVTLIDNRLKDAASVVATGQITPVTGMRLSPTAGAAELIPQAVSVFRALNDRFGAEFFRATPVFRAYGNEDERTLKAKRAAMPENAPWFGDEVAPGEAHPALNAPLGGFFITGGGRVDLPALLAAVREYFGGACAMGGACSPSAPGACGTKGGIEFSGNFAARSESTPHLISEPFVHAELVILPDNAGVSYRGITARHLVFAEGAAVVDNPWFGDLAWAPAKGEFITCTTTIPGLPDHALKIGLSAVPLGDGSWRVGSNYEWDNLDTTPTPAVCAELLAGFEAMFRVPAGAAVMEHLAGIRPAARGAKPIVGPHPVFPALHVFNGFGAKGCTWIPTYARDYAKTLRS